MGALLALAVAACQPFGGPPDEAADPTPTVVASPRRGAPVAGMPQALAALLDRTDAAAIEWQDEPRLAEVAVKLGADGRWREARALYVAADADRFLSLRASGDGVAQQRPTLATLGLRPVTEAGVASLPRLPGRVRNPGALASAAGEALAECGVTAPVRDVLYATGAPVTWDGSAWTMPPTWKATLRDQRGAGATVDPVTGAPVANGCLRPSGGEGGA